jgi:spermidine/putrescine transport system permease protein
MWQDMWNRFFFPLFVASMYLFLYVPFIILVIFSFNNSQFSFEWAGFTTKWYGMLWHKSEIWNALYNSIIVASSAVILSLTMSSLFVFFGTRQYIQKVRILFYANLAIPEIVLAVGLMSFFYFFSIPLGITTLIAAHTVLGLGYVVPLVYDRYADLDKKYVEASLDLGATPWQTFRLVVLPLLLPSLFAAGLLVFIISFDDFVLSFFCSGGTTQTLPMYIFALIRADSSPIVSALSTILLMVSSCIVLLFLSLQIRRAGIMR